MTTLETQPPRGTPGAAPVPSAYRVDRPAGPIDLWLDGNEGPRLDPETLARIQRPRTETLRRYPDASPLEARIAASLGRRPSEVLVTAGIDDGLDRACRAFLGPERALVLPSPTFVMLPRYARLAGAPLRELPWTRGPYPTRAVLDRMGPGTGAVAVVSPNNPTGCTADPADLRPLAERCAELGAVLLLDLAYVEYAENDPSESVSDLPSVLTFRTFSKARGLAGLRVGFVLGSAELCERMRAVGAPYPVSGFSLALAMERWSGGVGDLERHVAQVRSERGRLAGCLLERGFDVFEGEGNFVYLPDSAAPEIFARLAQRGIAVRLFEEGPNLQSALRISCPGRESDFQRLRTALVESLEALPESPTKPKREQA